MYFICYQCSQCIIYNRPFLEIPQHINVQTCRYSAVLTISICTIMMNLSPYGFSNNYCCINVTMWSSLHWWLSNLTELMVIEFKKELLDILDRRLPKRNYMQIVGDPCAGENYFFDCFSDACINKGQIGNFNRYCSFPLQDAKDKGVFLWYEPNVENAAYDPLKMLFGDNLPAKVKYQGRCYHTSNPDLRPDQCRYYSSG